MNTVVSLNRVKRTCVRESIRDEFSESTRCWTKTRRKEARLTGIEVLQRCSTYKENYQNQAADKYWRALGYSRFAGTLRKGPYLGDKRCKTSAWASFDIQVDSLNELDAAFYAYVDVNGATYPSKTYSELLVSAWKKRKKENVKPTASPNGLVSDVPPRNKSQIRVAKVSAWASEVKVAPPVAPPMLRVMIFPAAWHVWISVAINWQLASWLPGNTGSSSLLQIYHMQRRSVLGESRMKDAYIHWQSWFQVNPQDQRTRPKMPTGKRRQCRPK